MMLRATKASLITRRLDKIIELNRKAHNEKNSQNIRNIGILAHIDAGILFENCWNLIC